MKNIAEKNFKSELKFVYSDNNALSIIFQNNETLLGVVGEFNNNIKQLEEITIKNPNFSFWKKSPLQKLTTFMWENQNLWGEIIQKHPEKFPVLNFSKWQIENIDSFF